MLKGACFILISSSNIFVWYLLDSQHWGESDKSKTYALWSIKHNILASFSEQLSPLESRFYASRSPILKPSTIVGYITKTYPYNFDPLKPYFYIVKLGFTGVYIIFLISAQNIDCGYSLEPPRRGGSNEYT